MRSQQHVSVGSFPTAAPTPGARPSSTSLLLFRFLRRDQTFAFFMSQLVAMACGGACLSVLLKSTRRESELHGGPEVLNYD